MLGLKPARNPALSLRLPLGIPVNMPQRLVVLGCSALRIAGRVFFLALSLVPHYLSFGQQFSCLGHQF